MIKFTSSTGDIFYFNKSNCVIRVDKVLSSTFIEFGNYTFMISDKDYNLLIKMFIFPNMDRIDINEIGYIKPIL